MICAILRMLLLTTLPSCFNRRALTRHMDHEKDDRDLLIQVVVTLLKVSPLNVGPLNELEGLTLTVY